MLRLFQHILCFLEEDPSFVDVPQELSFVNEAFSGSMRWEVGRMLGSLLLLLGIFGGGVCYFDVFCVPADIFLAAIRPLRFWINGFWLQKPPSM